MELGKSVYKLETDSSKFDTGIDKAHEKTGKLAGGFSTAKVAAGIFAGVMTGAVVGALSSAANAAAEDEASVLALQQAVENSGASWDDNVDAIEARIKKGQELAFSDDATRASLQSLTESTGSVDEAMKRLPIAMDLARAKNISLEAASKLLGKVSDENTTALKKYGIVMEDGATATDVLAKVQKIAGGQAEKYGNSTKGSIDKVKDSIGEWVEGIGASLGPATGFIALLPGISSGMSVASGAVGGLSALMKGTMIPSFLATIPATIAMMVPFAPLLIAIAAIGLAVLVLKTAWENNWGDIQGKTQAVLGFLGGLFDGFKELLRNVWNGIIGLIQGAINNVLGIANGFIGAWNAVASKLGLPLIGEIRVSLPNLSWASSSIDQAAHQRNATIVVSTVYTGGGGGGNYISQYAMGTNHITSGPELFVAGEGGVRERVQVTPLSRSGSSGDSGSSGGSIDRPIVIQVPLLVEGRELAYAAARYDNGQARRAGYGIS